MSYKNCITDTNAKEVALTVDDTTITLTLATPDGLDGLTPIAADDIAASLKNSLTALSSIKTASVSYESENSQFWNVISETKGWKTENINIDLYEDVNEDLFLCKISK